MMTQNMHKDRNMRLREQTAIYGQKKTFDMWVLFRQLNSAVLLNGHHSE